MTAMRWTVLILILTTAVFACTAGAPSDETAAVRAAYDGYLKAILAGDGEKAVTMVSARTLTFYGRMLDASLRADRRAVEGLPFMDRMMIVTVRHRIPLAKARKMTAKTLFVHAVVSGWIGKESIRRNQLGEIAVDGAQAVGVVEHEGKETPLRYRFSREGGQWKFDLLALMSIANRSFGQVAEKRGTTENRFIMDVIGGVSGRPVQDSVWEPMIRE